ncbi:MAG: M48 family metallopeptidase [Prevotella sp.]|nr:M48 family metallopeptidase [Prevotella sp.]
MSSKTFKSSSLILVFALVALLTSCGTSRTVPVTGRKQTLMVSDEQMLSLSTQQYTEYMKTAKKSTDTKNTQMVQRVGTRLASAVETYLRNNGMASELNGYKWEFNLVQDKNVNAWCMPGGKIAVFEGLLPVTQTEDALAIVLGHEIAHAVAKHSAEQLSKQYKQQVGQQIAGSVLGAVIGSNAANIATWVGQQGLQLQNLKYSRDHENEADHMGLIFAAMAGYDPQVAVSFWQRMAASSSNKQSELFSDHPSDAKRIANIKGWMPEALQYYKK